MSTANTATPSVLIQCLLHRAVGTEIELYGEHYHFTSDEPANPKVPQVCAIPFDHARQIHRLLSIKGYALADPNAEIPPKPKAEAGQTIHLDKAGAADAPAEAAPVIIKSPDGQEVNLSAMERPELALFATNNFGIKVHHKWPAQTIIVKIMEALRAPAED
jgi:hypothetical protein